jgi:GNAT superfamily N-acetyltransferase
MALRPATRDDLDEIAALVNELAAYEEAPDDVTFEIATLDHHLFGPAPAAHVVMAIDDESSAVAGFALYFTTFSTWLGVPGIWLEDLFVRPQYRGRGYGAALLRHLRTLTAGRVEWAVLDWNNPAIEFYESLGARPVTGWTRYRWT